MATDTRGGCSLLLVAASILASSGCSASNASEIESVSPPVLAAPELMIHVIEPAARSFWKGYSEVLDENGWRDISPKTEADWKRVEDGAATLIVGGHLLLQKAYVREPADEWARLSQTFLDLAAEGKAQAEAQNKDAMLTLGERLDETCDSCHASFAPHVE